MQTPIENTDPFVVLAIEVGHLGRRLDRIGNELIALYSRPALRITGLVLVGAAVAKLVLFDLVALDGLAGVGAFLGAGSRYARLVAEAEAARSGSGSAALTG